MSLTLYVILTIVAILATIGSLIAARLGRREEEGNYRAANWGQRATTR